jgi:hypothetical protein
MAPADGPIHPIENAVDGLMGDRSADGVAPAAGRLSSLRTLSTTLWVTGQVLLVSYVVAVLTSIWPLQPLEPAWRLNAATNLVDNGGIPLIAMVLLHLAAQLDSRNVQRQAHRQRLARLALAAMTGFVLLIPLHVFSSLQLFEQLKSNRVSRLEKATYRLRNLSADIKAVGSHEQLKTRLLNFQGKSLSPQEMAQPLPELKRQLSAQIQEAIRRIEAQLPPPGWNQALPMVVTNLRLGLTALALAVGFAATGRRRGHGSSLLEETGAMFEERSRFRQQKRRSRQDFLRSLEEARLEQELLAEENARAASNPSNPSALQPDASRPAESSATSAVQQATSVDAAQQSRRSGIDLDYFELLSQEEQSEDRSPDSGQPSP